MDASDLGSGVARVQVTSVTNSAVRIAPFQPAAGYSAVEVVATAVDPNRAVGLTLQVTDSAGSAATCSNAAPPTSTTSTSTTTAPTTSSTTTTVPGAPTPFVTSFTPTNLRGDFSGWVGSRLTLGSTDIQVSSLGRWVVAGNTGSHVVKVVDAATGADLASVTVTTGGAPAGSFRYASLASPVTLRASTTYYLVTQETAGGDTWYDYDTRLVTSPAAADTGVVYSFPTTPTNWVPGGSPSNGFGPLSFLYR